MSPEFKNSPNPNIVQSLAGPRFISRPPTPEIGQLKCIEIRLYDEANGLCKFSPTNFVGALLVEENMDVFTNWFHHYNQSAPIPSDLSRPVETKSEVQIFAYNTHGASVESEDTHLSAPKVLVKNICGLLVGVVLEGPTTGLLLKKYPGHQYPNRMVADHLWVNHGFDYKPLNQIIDYIPITDEYLYKHLKPRQPSEIKAIFEEEKHIYGQMFMDAVKTSQAKTISDLFFYLCQKRGISVDAQNFHYTSAAIQS